jgi:hypothetical protein
MNNNILLFVTIKEDNVIITALSELCDKNTQQGEDSDRVQELGESTADPVFP